MSVTSLLRILAENPVRPWQYLSWIYPRDPDFAAKANVILDLYQGIDRGEPLGPGDKILFDAKPSIQARGRIRQTLPAAPGRPARVEHKYVRHGALALLAGLDVQTGKYSPPPPRPRASSRSSERYAADSAAVTYLKLFEESDNLFPGFESEMQGIFPRRDADGELRYYTYVIKE